MRRLFLLSCCILFAWSAFAQQSINGKVTDTKGKAIESVSINLKDSDGNILSFTRTNASGTYKLSLKSQNKGLRVEASSLGYKKAGVEITDPGKTYDLVLEDNAIDLAPVTVKNRAALSVSGDTLNYKTSDFADKQDRTIGDVIKRMPGIEVAESGKISYNGQAISKLYVDGDNLLDDKYNIATKSIPQDAVDKVQVIQNDQPIKMMRKNNMSEDVALNLVIKDDAKMKVMGDAMAGAGTPDKFDGNVSAMLFNKELKFVNNLKGNNIGMDPGMDVMGHNMADMMRRLETSKPANLLSTGAAGVPTLPQNRSLLNAAGLINLNNLYKFNSDLQLRANVSYLYDERVQQYNKLSEIYLPGQTVRYTELQDNLLNPQKLQTQLNLNENTELHYLNNNFKADYLPSQATSYILLNGAGANQSLNQKTFDISNEFNYRKKLKSENVLNLYSFLNRISQPEILSITPGLNADINNSGISYAGLDQYLKQPSWFTNNYASMAFVKNQFSQIYKAGFSVQQQEINSELYRIQNNGAKELLSSNAVNDLNWFRTRFYTEGTYELKKTKIQGSLSLPLSYNLISYQDAGTKLDKSIRRLFLTPSLNIKYQTGIETYLTMNYGFRNDLGGINDIYRGTILRNYRSFYANNSPLSEVQTHSIGGSFNFRKAMQMLFFNLTGNYSDAALNTISSVSLTDNIQQSVALPLSNHIRTYSLSASASKYLFDLSSTVNAGVSFNHSTFDQLQNNQLIPLISEMTSYRGGIESKLAKFMTGSYNLSYSVSNNKATIGNDIKNNYQQLRQQSTLSFTTFKNVYVNLSGEHLYTQQSTQPDLQYLFADMNLKYKLVKMKTDLEFGITNLANIKTFDALNLSANSFTSGSYRIPGRIAMLKARFNF
ncbi:carboxypeptidase regulatory-like domain-containing protein [Daejeonella sp.]|uniref:TonB-dependent receptor n=1 Tax=Daejeonella sp. TaxID=2805397 RepID=UPI0030BD723F